MIYLVEFEDGNLLAVDRQNNIPGGIVGFVLPDQAAGAARQIAGKVVPASVSEAATLCWQLKLVLWIQDGGGMNYIQETIPPDPNDNRLVAVEGMSPCLPRSR
ncbi:MAG: hypothetical protein KDE34_20545 [Anaerolineales bacterium]|nr:hypothetical protein [Anaerolineales bacterium]